MRVGFSTRDHLNEKIEVYSSSVEFQVRRAWEARYNVPSLGNPLFEEVPVMVHVVHLLASNKADDARDSDETPDDAPDERLSDIMESLESGEDPFVDIREKLRRLSGNLEEFEDIDFERS